MKRTWDLVVRACHSYADLNHYYNRFAESLATRDAIALRHALLRTVDELNQLILARKEQANAKVSQMRG